MSMPKGWKAYLGAGILGLMAVLHFLNGEIEKGIEKAAEALAIIGIRAKLERTDPGA